MSEAVTVRTSRAAQASLILGLMCLVLGPLAAISRSPGLALAAFALFFPALILGIIGHIRIHRSAGWLRGEWLANGAITATICGFFISLLVPAT